tara:strand:- start:265 stop:465 length:201 start_codon:yes stop_codon:yes gene_type:complete
MTCTLRWPQSIAVRGCVWLLRWIKREEKRKEEKILKEKNRERLCVWLCVIHKEQTKKTDYLKHKHK